MKDIENELLPCPFCGARVAEISNAHDLEECANFEDERCPCERYEDVGECSYFTIVCGINNGGCGSSSGYFATKEKAIEAWNSRCEKANMEMSEAYYGGGWIPCSERMPGNEQEVEITYIRQNYLTGEKRYSTARAFYEDGTLTTEDSAYNWNETDNWEYDESRDACIIPEGWCESVSFTEEGGVVDMPVIAWKPIPEPYRGDS